ncbi:MAG TPA: hypothetical protein VLM37_13740 [Fibrobacteraceae bacterium]|nr:hypothetical protein [Fibrobacteraceae bacterium]
MKILVLSIFLLSSLGVTGCSSLQPREDRVKSISEFLNQEQHYALFDPTSIQSEEKLNLFGVPDYGKRISRQYEINSPVVRVIETFTQSSPVLSRTIIVAPEKAKDLSLPPSYPVLFFHSDWHLIYRRLPPNFYTSQLQVGMISKIIPLGQVLSGHGPTALKTASWEGKCTYDAFEGKFFSLDEWEANNAERLRQGITAAQDYCAEKFISEFANQR